jgi:hypothetical protein
VKVASTSQKSAGKWYWEITLTTVDGGWHEGVGICTIGTTNYGSAQGGVVGASVNTANIDSGQIFANGVQVGTMAIQGNSGDVWGIAADLDNYQIWFKNKKGGVTSFWNANGAADPIANVGGFALPAGAMVPFVKMGGFSGGGAVYTANFGGSPFVLPFPLIPTGLTMAVWGTVTSVTLSANNLIATNTGTTSSNQGAMVAAASGKTTGKYYFEMVGSIPGGSGGQTITMGVATTSSAFSTLGGNLVTVGAGLFTNGIIAANGVNTGINIGDQSAGGEHFICVAVDLDNRKIWFRPAGTGNWNANATYDPATNVGGVTIPAGTIVPYCTFGGITGGSGNSYAANFGQFNFTGAVPAGFTAGWPP